MRPLERIKSKPPALIKILEHPHTKVITLRGMESSDVVELVSRQLGVEVIPDLLQEIIIKRSHGVPLWCEELVETMLELGYLKIVDEQIPTSSNQTTAAPTTKREVMITYKPSKSNSTISFENIPIPESVNGMVLARIDHMSPSEQMTLKCAAILGTIFTRTMLQALISEVLKDSRKKSQDEIFRSCLNNLAEAGIIECAVAAKVRSRKCEENEQEAIQHSISSLYCPCLENMVTKPTHSLHKHHTTYPLVEECQSLQFIHNYIQETAYSLWTEQHRKKLHEAAAHFLESQAHKCKNCGGGDFLAGRNFSLLQKRKNIGHQRAFKGGGGGIQPRQSSLARQSAASIQKEDNGRKISVNVLLDIDMEECHCDSVLAYVYPQLVRHWRAAGDLHNTLVYLIEEASAAVATYNNMEALSLLQEANEIIDNNRSVLITNYEQGRLQSLFGQVNHCTRLGHKI